jgi:hypothetical protein
MSTAALTKIVVANIAGCLIYSGGFKTDNQRMTLFRAGHSYDVTAHFQSLKTFKPTDFDITLLIEGTRRGIDTPSLLGSVIWPTMLPEPR